MVLKRLVNSARNRIAAARFNSAVRRLQADIERSPLGEVKREFESSNLSYSKYFDIGRCSPYIVQRVQRLELDRMGPMRCLDLGCGFGYFGVALRSMGHKYIGLDYDDPQDQNTALFRSAFKALNPDSERISHRINRFEPIPKPAEHVDLVTAFQICFTNFNKQDAWSAREWCFLLNDLGSVLVDDGRFHFHFSKPDHSDELLPADVLTLFECCGAKIDLPYVTLNAASVKRFLRTREGTALSDYRQS